LFLVLSPFSLWEKGWGRGTYCEPNALSLTLSQREREFKQY